MKTLIEQQIREMGSAKVQLCMSIKWLKRDEVTGEVVEIVDLPFNSKMREIFSRFKDRGDMGEYVCTYQEANQEPKITRVWLRICMYFTPRHQLL